MAMCRIVRTIRHICMTPEEIKAIVEATLNEQLPQVLQGAFSEFNNHFEGILNEKLKTKEEPKDSTLLDKRIQQLEQKLKQAEQRELERQKEAQELRFTNSLNATLNAKGVLPLFHIACIDAESGNQSVASCAFFFIPCLPS